jgi:hypothetical protein
VLCSRLLGRGSKLRRGGSRWGMDVWPFNMVSLLQICMCVFLVQSGSKPALSLVQCGPRTFNVGRYLSQCTFLLLQVLREAEVSTRMDHPNLVATVSAGQPTRNLSRRPCLASGHPLPASFCVPGA